MGRSVSPPTAPRLLITPRDLDMLHSLHAARFLTVEALEWLHFPTWHVRYRGWLERQQAGSSRHYIPSANLYSRLRRMEAARLVRRIYRPIAMAVSVQKRDADLWLLDDKGADLLAAYGGLERAAIQVPEVRPRSTNMLEHSAAIGKVYAALSAKLQTRPDLAIVGWWNDYQTKQDYDRIETWFPRSGSSATLTHLPVQPDGVLLLQREGRVSVLLIEVERDRPPEAWKKKVYAWESYRGSPALKQRYGVGDFLVLAFSLTDAQRRALMTTTAQAVYAVTGHDAHRTEALLQNYFFYALPDVHPFQIGTAWHTISKIHVQVQSLPTGGVAERVAVDSEPYTLIWDSPSRTQ